MDYKVFESSEGNVWKYVFTKSDMVAEAVLYKYNDFYDRTVICCSVMSGCPVGCTFCGTGAKFIRNLKADEIVEQIENVLASKGLINDVNNKCKKLQFMFMSMGEPMLNWNEMNYPPPNLKIRRGFLYKRRRFTSASILFYEEYFCPFLQKTL